jgi:predicted small secreted protein
MRKFIILAVLCLGAILTGCNGAADSGCGNGVVNSYSDRQRMYNHNLSYMRREFVDDWDTLWLADRPSYLSYWYFRDFE